MLAPAMGPRRVLDCDTGRDDALALFMAKSMHAPPEAVICTYGNVALDQVIDNNRRVLGLIDPDHQTRLFTGCAQPLRPHHGWHSMTLPRQAQSGNGLCHVVLPTVMTHAREHMEHIDGLARWLTDSCAERGAVDYIVTGPMTTLATLVDVLGSNLDRCIRSVTMMGGKFDSLWHAMPGPDFNIACDPFAFDRVLSTPLPLRIVPMNVTWPIALSIDTIEALEARSECGRWAKEIMVAYCRAFSPDGLFRFHDPVAYLAAIRPLAEETASIRIVCDEQSADFARLYLDPSGRAVRIVSPDAERTPEILSVLLDALDLVPRSHREFTGMRGALC